MELLVTSLTAGLLGLMMLPLALNVTFRRIQLGNVHIGDAGDPKLLRRIRAHGNFSEYVPVSLIVLGLAELGNASVWILTTCAALLVVGRAIHATGALYAPNSELMRGSSMLMTHAAYVVPSIWLLKETVL